MRALQKSKSKRRDEPGLGSPAQQKKFKGKPPWPHFFWYPRPQRPHRHCLQLKHLPSEAYYRVLSLGRNVKLGSSLEAYLKKFRSRRSRKTFKLKRFRFRLYAALQIGSVSSAAVGDSFDNRVTPRECFLVGKNRIYPGL
ncbi:hypothetical protein EVAR_95525_1 [Eumeta japonica]|uniref:Uncharacterized protein n=1 Tax=Eumeta variegata TaxID=151549 RepID=A0A4C1UK51_EUMVA|nr:hypothetical protein EVAR_95525_1 [Eumeta japonica]